MEPKPINQTKGERQTNYNIDNNHSRNPEGIPSDKNPDNAGCQAKGKALPGKAANEEEGRYITLPQESIAPINGSKALPPDLPAPLMVGAKEAARLCGAKKTTWKAWNDSGKIPSPIRISARKILWRVEELRSWLNMGCPPRHKWQWPTAHWEGGEA
jgi:predicted DNA-binding transcriptional regulator AlpA